MVAIEDNRQRKPARIGQLRFTYSDPAVNVTTEQRVIEHDTIDNQIAVQTKGRKPDQLSIEGVVPAYELDVIDNLTATGVLEVRTERWDGDVIVTSTNTDFKRAKSIDNGWLYDATIECLEVDELTEFDKLLQENPVPDDAISEREQAIRTNVGASIDQ